VGGPAVLKGRPGGGHFLAEVLSSSEMDTTRGVPRRAVSPALRPLEKKRKFLGLEGQGGIAQPAPGTDEGGQNGWGARASSRRWADLKPGIFFRGRLPSTDPGYGPPWGPEAGARNFQGLDVQHPARPWSTRNFGGQHFRRISVCGPAISNSSPEGIPKRTKSGRSLSHTSVKGTPGPHARAYPTTVGNADFTRISSSRPLTKTLVKAFASPRNVFKSQVDRSRWSWGVPSLFLDGGRRGRGIERCRPVPGEEGWTRKFLGVGARRYNGKTDLNGVLGKAGLEIPCIGPAGDKNLTFE